jgi:hypothetical protein
MNVARIFELAETANDTELYWLFTQLQSAATKTSEITIYDVLIFHRLYGKKIATIVCAWVGQGHRCKEMIESVEEPMRARLEA